MRHIDSRLTTKGSTMECEVLAENSETICPKISGQEFDEPLSEEETLSFIKELGHSGVIKLITDVKVDHLHQPWRTFATIINKCLSEENFKRNSDLGHFTPRKLLPRRSLTKLQRGYQNEAEDFSQSLMLVRSSDGNLFLNRDSYNENNVISGTDEETGTKPGVPDVPKYDSESKKESWGDSGEEDDDDDDEDESDDDKGNDDDGDNDDNDDDSADERTESDRDENPNLNQSSKEHEEEEYVNERVHTPKNYELTDEEDNANNTKEGMKKRKMMMRNYTEM
ncbi:hypothetical protein Tco_1402405 [Tanacetum coccineum]